MARESKTLSFEVKATGITVNAEGQEVGQIEAYGAVFGNIDEGNDRINKGAFKRTIQNSQARAKARKKYYVLPMLWQHKSEELIGSWHDLNEDEFGLHGKGDILLATQRGHEYYELAKAGMSDLFSIIYDVPQDGAKYTKDGIRDLTELRLYSLDPVTFAMNDETYLVGVKSTDPETKSVCGNTSGSIGPRDEAWDGSAAEKWIWGEALDSDGNVKSAVAKKYFMRLDGDATLKGSYSYPFWIDGHISVGGVKAIAGALSGARNASAGGDSAGLKSKVETLYSRINKKYPDDTELTPPWKNDGKARSHMNTSTKQIEKKTFLEHYAEEMAEDLLEDWQDVLLCALSCAVLDAFKIGDTPETDIREALTAFNDAVMAWVAQGIEYGLSDYLEETAFDYSPADHTIQYGSDSQPNYGHDYMSRRKPDAKAMTAGDATTGGFTTDHVDKLKGAATKAMKAMQAHADGLHDAADTVTKLVDGANREKARALPYGTKAGRMFSSANVQALSDHADSLHDMADAHTKAMTRYTKAVNTVADDLAQTIQGAEAAYGTDPGDAGDRQEGKTSQRTPFNDRTRTTQHTRSSHDDTVTEDEIVAALGKLKALKTV